MSTFLDFAVAFAQVCFALAMVFATIRLFRGPGAQDRVLALDTLYINGMLTLLMLGIRTSTTMYFDIALLIALLALVLAFSETLGKAS